MQKISLLSTDWACKSAQKRAKKKRCFLQRARVATELPFCTPPLLVGLVGCSSHFCYLWAEGLRRDWRRTRRGGEKKSTREPIFHACLPFFFFFLLCFCLSAPPSPPPIMSRRRRCQLLQGVCVCVCVLVNKCQTFAAKNAKYFWLYTSICKEFTNAFWKKNPIYFLHAQHSSNVPDLCLSSWAAKYHASWQHCTGERERERNLFFCGREEKKMILLRLLPSKVFQPLDDAKEKRKRSSVASVARSSKMLQ